MSGLSQTEDVVFLKNLRTYEMDEPYSENLHPLVYRLVSARTTCSKQYMSDVRIDKRCSRNEKDNLTYFMPTLYSESVNFFIFFIFL